MIRKLLIAALLVGAVPFSSALAQTRPRDVRNAPVSAPTIIGRYGSAPEQFGELRLPAGRGPFPVAVVIHGGCWTRSYETLEGTAPIATALANRGVATWNVEYRALGDPGAGWPGTFQDWGAATDYLRVLARHYPIDLNRVTVIGHSAGAHAAAFVASRPRLAAGLDVRGGNPLQVAAVVPIDGPPDVTPFVGADAAICGQPVIAPLMGGTPTEQPARYSDTSAVAHLPLGVPMFLVSGSPVLSPEAAEAYRATATAHGDRVEILAPTGSDHFNIIYPGRPQWTEVENYIVERAIRLRRPR